MYLADGHDEKVWVLDRASMEVLTSFGSGGKQPGQFYAVHSIAVDSKGNIYTTETYDGRRLQRFMLKGMQTVEKGKEQGTVWPKKS
jgi:DNA-binding beta-propeller fold protein YncE